MEVIVLEIGLLSELKFDILNPNYQKKTCHMKQETRWLCFGLRSNAELMANEAREDGCGPTDGKLFKVKTIQRQKRVFGEAVSSPPPVSYKHRWDRSSVRIL